SSTPWGVPAMNLAYLTLLFAAQPVLNKPPPPPMVQPVPKAETLAASEEQILKAAHLGTDGPALLDFFRRRAAPPPDKAQLDALLAKLGDKTAATADSAAGALIALGPNVIPALRPLANNPDGGDATVRARHCLQMIEGTKAAALTGTAARLLATQKPEG